MSEHRPNRIERYGQGKALRTRTPRERHADWSCPPDRDLLGMLAESDTRRLPELVDERYRRMSKDAFAFFRGAAAVMAHDLSDHAPAGVPVQACGDCHLMNFGAFVSPEENILFNVNDFDETLPGVDFTVDVKRLAASVAVAAETAQIPKTRARAIARDAVGAYRRHMRALSMLSPLEAWNSHIDLARELDDIGDKSLQRSLKTLIAGARGAGLETDDNFPRLVKGSDFRIADKPPTIFHIPQDADPNHSLDASQALESYRRALPPERAILLGKYRLRDLVFKAVGVGSVGAFCCVGLFSSDDDEPLLLQVKEAQRSVLEQLAGARSYEKPQGRRVVEGQRMMQAAPDLFLGWTEDEKSGRQFYVRRLKNRRLGDVSQIAEQGALSDYSRLCGRTLARAHARSADPATIAGYMGKGEAFDDALASFAMSYAEQTVRDFVALSKARDRGFGTAGATHS